MGSWGCPHEIQGVCQKVAQRACDPGMKGCVLAGRYVFANSEDKNTRLRVRQLAGGSTGSVVTRKTAAEAGDE